MALYTVAFPDFDPATLPPIPAGWEDASYRNETCPSWSFGGLRIHVDFADIELREFQDEAPRFTVSTDDEAFETILQSDDWNEVLAAVEARAA